MKNLALICGLAVGLAGCATAPQGGGNVSFTPVPGAVGVNGPVIPSAPSHKRTATVAPKVAATKKQDKLPTAPVVAQAAPAVAVPLTKPRWYDRLESRLHKLEDK